MNKKNEIEAKVTATLNSLEGIQTGSPGPFFFTRLQARINRTERNIWEKTSTYLARPVVAMTVICFVILMNAVAVFQQNDTSTASTEQPEQTAYEEFNIATNTLYDYETMEP